MGPAALDAGGAAAARAAGWVAVTVLLVPCVVCSALTVGYSWRAHYPAGVPIKRTVSRWEGRPVYHPTGGPAAARPKVPITEDEFRAWEENMDASRRWAGRAAAFFPKAVLAVLLIGRSTRGWTRTGPGPPKRRPPRTQRAGRRPPAGT